MAFPRRHPGEMMLRTACLRGRRGGDNYIFGPAIQVWDAQGGQLSEDCQNGVTSTTQDSCWRSSRPLRGKQKKCGGACPFGTVTTAVLLVGKSVRLLRRDAGAKHVFVLRAGLPRIRP